MVTILLNTSSLSLAKRRAARRAHDGGAVMFIVAMTIAIIAAMGVYALNIASVEVKTAGFLRQNVQTHYLSEYGVLGAAQEVSGAKAQLYRDLMIKTPDTQCTSLYGIPGPAITGPLPQACRRVGSVELGKAWAITPPLTTYLSNASETARGSVGLPTAPDFYVELTDPTQKTSPSGYGLDPGGGGGLCFVQFTVAAVGITQAGVLPPLPSSPYLGEGLETARARITGGPIKCN
jgi:hypothetical protein